MKTLSLFLCGLCILMGVAASAQRQPEVVYPASPFNKEETKRALEPGSSTVRGVIVKKLKNLNNTYLGIQVELFPYTTYFGEWLELRKKNKKGRKIPAMTNEAYSYRILAKASDNDGTFEYKNLKPGKYYLQAMVKQGKMDRVSVQVGQQTTTGYNVHGQAISSSTIPIFETYKFFYDTNDLVTTIVEITADGQVIEIKL